jgi:hypothetical protein
MRSRDPGEGRSIRWSALPLALALLCTASTASGQEISWTGTASYSKGSYIFDAATHTFHLFNGLRLSSGRLDLSGSIPVVLQNSQLVSQVGGATLPTGGQDNGAVAGRQPGQKLGTGRGGGGGGGMVTYRDEYALELGDPFFTAAARVYEGTGVLRSVQTQLSTKAPLRDLDSGVGTGEWDFGAGGSAFAALGSTYAFIDVGYWWYGDLPHLELADGLTYGIGLSRSLLDSRGSLLASFLGADPAIASMDRPAAVGLGFSYSPRLGRSVSTGVMVGLSEASPDLSVYAGWSMKVR